jgi:hypothetical protein
MAAVKGNIEVKVGGILVFIQPLVSGAKRVI